ncbi:hypothetical protein RB195_024255 [Necator americanus]|uniref:Uncharacterized protein n=1 Tax=Necator americanus TaxID=51031 RepID=A0ABR1EMJ4_NECAM
MDGRGLVVTGSPSYACSGLPAASSAGTYPAADNRLRVPNGAHPVYLRMTCEIYQHLAPPSKVAKVNRLHFFDHFLRRPADRSDCSTSSEEFVGFELKEDGQARRKVSQNME